jgi:amidase
MSELAFKSATELARMIRSRDVGCTELLDYFIGRMNTYNPSVNAIIVQDLDAAHARATAADQALARGEEVGPLFGVPMTIKESFNLAGTPTTWGFPNFKDNIASSNAVAVDRLLRAGANIFGKTNVPPGLMDGQSNNEIYGRTNNPWDLSRTPGGSSGGSAAALASGMTGLEFGSDIASSIRNPAHYCGVFGHKSTWGICPQRGHMLVDTLQPTDIGVVGPLARSVPDLELALSAVVGPDGADAKGYASALPPAQKTSLKDFRVALVCDDSFAEVDRTVSDQLTKLGDFLEKEGARVSRNDRPKFDSEELYILFMILLRAASAGSVLDKEFSENLKAAKGASRATRDVAKANAYGVTLSHRDWLRLDEERQGYRVRWIEFFERFDVLLCPVLSTPAFSHKAGSPQGRMLAVNGHEVPFEKQLFWAGYGGLFYLPATVAPIGLSPEGLPIGVQIIASQYDDHTSLRFAALLEERYRAFVPPPGYGD